MNIFVLDQKPLTAAEMLCDCHLRKMCIETAQILSALVIRDGVTLLPDMPKPQNLKHPVITAIDTPEKTNWVVLYNTALHCEYCQRFKKKHEYEKLTKVYFNILATLLGGTDCTGLAKCCGELDVADLDIVTAYKKYYTEVKKPQLTAKNKWHFTNRKDWTE